MSNNPVKLTPSNLSALMCARICHDLVSPVGALSAALEVLGDESNADMHEDAMSLVRTSAEQAAAKLKFLRLAFGAGTSAPGVIGMDHTKALVEDMYKSGKAAIRWETNIEGLEKSHTRLILNLAMIAVQSIPRGGDLTIGIAQTPDAHILTLSAEGPKARISPEFLRALSGKAPDGGFDGRTIQPFYTGMIVRELKGRVDANLDGETAKFSVFLPSIAAKNAA
ncbi:MAG: hypothetical protein HKN36_13325 [Hellea sp.]|nr:hypothetical protein [Hellea sp.]